MNCLLYNNSFSYQPASRKIIYIGNPSRSFSSEAIQTFLRRPASNTYSQRPGSVFIGYHRRKKVVYIG